MKTKIHVWAALMLMSLTPLHAAEPAPAIEPQARAVIASIASRLRQAEAFSVDVDLIVVVQMAGMKNEMPQSYSFFRQKPDHFALLPRGEAGPMTHQSVLDGTNFYTYMPMLKEYTVTVVPPGADVADLASPGITGGSFFEVLTAKDPEKAILGEAKAARLAGTEKVGGVDCQRVVITEEAVTWDLWADAGANPLVRKVAVDLTRMVRSVVEDQDSALSEVMKGAKMTATLFFTNWVLPARIPAERFRFIPPAGAKLAQNEDDDEGENEGLVGEPAPKFKAKLLGGGEFDLAAHKGSNVVILDFWATWCAPCVRSLPVVAEVAKAYEKRGVVFVAVNQQDEPEKIEAFVAKHRLAMKVALDPEGDVGESYNLESIPQTVIVDREGVVRSVHVGALPDLRAKLTNALEEVLGPKGAEPTKR